MPELRNIYKEAAIFLLPMFVKMIPREGGGGSHIKQMGMLMEIVNKTNKGDHSGSSIL